MQHSGDSGVIIFYLVKGELCTVRLQSLLAQNRPGFVDSDKAWVWIHGERAN